MSVDGESLVKACPFCNKAGHLYARKGRGNAYQDDPDDPYYCWECGRSFDDPVVRERINPSGGRDAGVDPELLEQVRERMGIGEGPG